MSASSAMGPSCHAHAAHKLWATTAGPRADQSTSEAREAPPRMTAQGRAARLNLHGEEIPSDCKPWSVEAGARAWTAASRDRVNHRGRSGQDRRRADEP